MAIILGIDPGSRKMGYGVINQVGSRQEYIASGCIRLEKLSSFPERLDAIFVYVSEVIERYLPQELAIEEVFMGVNAQSALKLGQARGCAIVAATQASMPVYEYAARKVKQAIVGNGNADKTQMGLMVKHLLKLPGLPQEDAADALAIAMCHGHSRQQLLQTNGARFGRNGRMSLNK